MSKLSRLLTALAAIALLGAFAWPLWSIGLVAPQYPEGLGMKIRLTTVQGASEHDLTNINELNHYIGMKVIDPDAIPELKYMPWAVAGLSVLGLLVAASGRRRLLVGWVALLAVGSAAGLADFWRWTYDYGHDIDIEHAIIKIPGTFYQPPIFGVKQILNFTATSWPALGGIAVMVGVTLALAATVLAFREHDAHVLPAA
ncbi:hypothetical protein BH11GEM1_BH11GEM1_09260 [soil metagenome]